MRAHPLGTGCDSGRGRHADYIRPAKHSSSILFCKAGSKVSICAGQEQRWHSEKIDNDATLLSGRDIRKGPCMHQAAPLGAWTAEQPVGGLAKGEQAS